MGKIADSIKTRGTTIGNPPCHYANPPPKDTVNLTQNQRANIRLVMEHLSIPNTTSNYLKYSEWYDWDLMAENIRNPKYPILCDIVYNGERCGRIFVNVAAPDRASAILKIKNNNCEYGCYEPVPK